MNMLIVGGLAVLLCIVLAVWLVWQRKSAEGKTIASAPQDVLPFEVLAWKDETERKIEEVKQILNDTARGVEEVSHNIIRRNILSYLISLRNQLKHKMREYENGGLFCKSLGDQIEELFNVLGIEIYSPEPGSEFRAESHRAVKCMETTEERISNTIAHVQKEGYRFISTGTVIVPAEVEIYKSRNGGNNDEKEAK